jgi:hypothetical protein
LTLFIELLRIQPEIEKPIFLVPLRCVYSRFPLKMSKDQKKRNVHERFQQVSGHCGGEQKKKAISKYGEPIDIRDFSGKFSESSFIEDTAEKIKNELRHRIASWEELFQAHLSKRKSG